MSETPDLDIAPIAARSTIIGLHLIPDLAACIAEIHRLRALLAAEQAKTAPLESVFDTVKLWAYIYREANNGSISDSEDVVIKTYLEACKELGRQP